MPKMGNDGQKVQLDLDALRAMTGVCAYNATALAHALGVSGRHLRRLFVRELRCPPRTWLREERLQTARRLLLRAATVQEVAHSLSFRNASQFCRDFRARFGQTPSELKRGRGLLGRPPAALVRESAVARIVAVEPAAMAALERDVGATLGLGSVLVEARCENTNRVGAPGPVVTGAFNARPRRAPLDPQIETRR